MSSNPKTRNTDEAGITSTLAPGGLAKRYTFLIVIMLFGSATTGYFLGLTSPMTAQDDRANPASIAIHSVRQHDNTSRVVSATAYADMPEVVRRTRRESQTRLASLKQEPYNMLANIQINPSEKLLSLAHRETRRAYNGAPPTVPHPIDQLNSAACMACHAEGLRSKSLRAGKMPHPYYSNCTQCHVEKHAEFTVASASFENTFQGTKAPTAGSRAYVGAPPVVPHSTWMRNDCLACHGRTAAPGMESTHPWRANCLQCHSESSQLNQTPLIASPQFLPAPQIQPKP